MTKTGFRGNKTEQFSNKWNTLHIYSKLECNVEMQNNQQKARHKRLLENMPKHAMFLIGMDLRGS